VVGWIFLVLFAFVGGRYSVSQIIRVSYVDDGNGNFGFEGKVGEPVFSFVVQVELGVPFLRVSTEVC
jgi:hypothetical protein